VENIKKYGKGWFLQAMSEERNASYRNLAHTPLNPSCRLCHYSGYSNVCTFFSGGECPYISMKKSMSGEREAAKTETASSLQTLG
jgi:hypothetical protein